MYATIRQFLDGTMAIIYLEDLPEKIGNKYLAVNAIAQRARVLNDRNLQFLNSNSKTNPPLNKKSLTNLNE